MRPKRSIEIVGGGLAGLSLGLALRRAGTPVKLFDAGDYPRHRVCGEFIAGLDAHTIEVLGLSSFLSGALPQRRIAWFLRERFQSMQILAEPALVLSRRGLDEALAQAFQAAGGELVTKTRIDCKISTEGRVIAAGRRANPSSRWIGLNFHVDGLETRAPLEMHLGEHAYVGICELPGKEFNVCGLFQKRSGVRASREGLAVAYLQACGLQSLARRIADTPIRWETMTAVSGIEFTAPSYLPRRIQIGDALATLPPFTGNGMAMAFQGACCVLNPLVAWAHEAVSWTDAVRTANEHLRRQLRIRFALARYLHPLVYRPTFQPLFALAQRLRLVRFAYPLLH